MNSNSFNEFKERIKSDSYEDSIRVIRRNHNSLKSIMKCKFCRYRLKYMLGVEQ